MSNVCVWYFCCIYYKVQNNELSIDEIPSRALMWRKARENKNGEYKNVVKDMADKLGPQTKGSSKERISQLEFQLHNERLEHGKKDEQLKTLSMQMA
ncbi:hypothetical protein Hanom_Chr11g01045341 [Helianthus anomalus]